MELLRIELLRVFESKPTNLERVRGLGLVVDGIGGIGSEGQRRKGPYAAVSEIDNHLGINLLGVIWGANKEGSRLEEVVGVGGLRKNRLGRAEGPEDKCEKNKHDRCEKNVGGSKGAHVRGNSFAMASGDGPGPRGAIFLQEIPIIREKQLAAFAIYSAGTC
jgi:hypothetical protein